MRLAPISLAMQRCEKSSDPVATIGIDIGKNTFRLMGLDKRGTIVKLSRTDPVCV